MLRQTCHHKIFHTTVCSSKTIKNFFNTALSNSPEMPPDGALNKKRVVSYFSISSLAGNLLGSWWRGRPRNNLMATAKIRLSCLYNFIRVSSTLSGPIKCHELWTFTTSLPNYWIMHFAKSRLLDKIPIIGNQNIFMYVELQSCSRKKKFWV